MGDKQDFKIERYRKEAGIKYKSRDRPLCSIVKFYVPVKIFKYLWKYLNYLTTWFTY